MQSLGNKVLTTIVAGETEEEEEQKIKKICFFEWSGVVSLL